MSDKKDDTLATLRRRVAQASTGPGVYRWIDAEGNVMYVGKAKNLRNRLRNYVQERVKRSAWTEIMVRQIADFDLTLTNTDLEALMLETNLIKELKPKYNIMMKDDKNYVYLRISVQDTYPRIDIVRRMEEDGALYFGPKTSAESLRRALAFLRTLFPFRTCKMGIEIRSKTQDPRSQTNPKSEEPNPKSDVQQSSPSRLRVENDQQALNSERLAMSSDSQSPKLKAQSSSDSSQADISSPIHLDVVCHDRDRPTPCLDHHIQQCSAPCIGNVTPEQYRRESIDGVIEFFQGKYQDLEVRLKEEMMNAAKDKKFERAAMLRDHLQYVQNIQEKQLVSDTSGADTDIIGTALLSGHAYIVLLQERGGKIVNEESFGLQGQAETMGEVLSKFIPQYYSDAADLPDTIIAGEEPDERASIEQWLSSVRGKKVALHVPERGKKSKLLLLAEKNADWKARQSEAKWESETRKTEDALIGLQSILQLPNPPHRIEGYDISHLGGNETVGSMVVFVDGKPKREHYRSFNMRTVKEGNVDDYKSLTETLTRRVKYLIQSTKREEQMWEQRGILVGKAKKDEQGTIESIISDHREFLGNEDIDYKDFVVARSGEEIVGFGRLHEDAAKILQLKTVWVAEAYQGDKLGHFIARKLLKTVKKGKVYVTINAQLESYYNELGFRYVIEPPPSLAERMKQFEEEHGYEPGGIAMVYSVKDNKADESFSATPDLILIDGGKGQLQVAIDVLAKFNLAIPVVSLAKREEDIFIPGQPDPVHLKKDAPAQFLLRRLRDEAHRFANDRRKRRGKKAMTRSILDDVPGIGEKLKQQLLDRFGSTDGIRAASDEEVEEVVGVEMVGRLRDLL